MKVVARGLVPAALLAGTVASGCGALTPDRVPPITCDEGAEEITAISCTQAALLVLPQARADVDFAPPPSGQDGRAFVVSAMRFRAALPCMTLPGGQRECEAAERGRALVVVTVAVETSGLELVHAYRVQQGPNGLDVADVPLPYCAPPVRCDPE